MFQFVNHHKRPPPFNSDLIISQPEMKGNKNLDKDLDLWYNKSALLPGVPSAYPLLKEWGEWFEKTGVLDSGCRAADRGDRMYGGISQTAARCFCAGKRWTGLDPGRRAWRGRRRCGFTHRRTGEWNQSVHRTQNRSAYGVLRAGSGGAAHVRQLAPRFRCRYAAGKKGIRSA